MASFSRLSSSTLSDAAEKLEPHSSSILPTYDATLSPEFIDFFALEGNQADEEAPPETEVSTELSLAFGTAVHSPVRAVVPGDLHRPAEDNWEIVKELRGSDVDGSSRLMLKKPWVQEHILPHVMGQGVGVGVGEGVEVVVWDVDTGSEHVLVLKKWRSGSFVLVKNWMSDFVRRRGLEKEDEIGLRWDDENSRLEFTVLGRN
ncbi:UNVERIFIED_CONTAM: putative B3 domain-containing protein [Sesamum radiatum]|uniref:B3 domain-containing protein n=1 Tax=Sesamum radiatum TaxID=300843 RepID=A0AAW2W5E8_SESRA